MFPWPISDTRLDFGFAVHNLLNSEKHGLNQKSDFELENLIHSFP